MLRWLCCPPGAGQVAVWRMVLARFRPNTRSMLHAAARRIPLNQRIEGATLGGLVQITESCRFFCPIQSLRAP